MQRIHLKIILLFQTYIAPFLLKKAQVIMGFNYALTFLRTILITKKIAAKTAKAGNNSTKYSRIVFPYVVKPVVIPETVFSGMLNTPF